MYDNFIENFILVYDLGGLLCFYCILDIKEWEELGGGVCMGWILEEGKESNYCKEDRSV